ncbi:hypothetical protein [Acidocella sp.]|uniref:hypothetical protein n=1 Tax=Acidocella sp. TaxID=50710 RepID=UPI0026249F30|nr:hypothetical protein [Acidocella sp.]
MPHISDHLSLRSALTASRLSRGALALLRPPRQTASLISFDIFGTLLERKADEHYAARQSANETLRSARLHGLETPPDGFAFRRHIERQLLLPHLSAGTSEEMHNKTIIQAMLRALGAGDWAEPEAERLAAFELDQEITCTRANTPLAAELQRYLAKGQRVIAISDTRYSAGELQRLLAAAGITGLARIYASADWQSSKFRGTLFDIVAREEHTPPGQILHIGDNFAADSLAAAERGFQTRFVRRSPPLPPLPKAPPTSDTDPAYRLGYEVFGPTLVGFTYILFETARARGLKRLVFLSRDGFLLHEVAKRLQPTSPLWRAYMLDYFKISRRLMMSATMRFSSLDDATRAQLTTDLRLLRGPADLIARLGAMFNLPPGPLAAARARLGQKEGNIAELHRLLNDKEACESFDECLAANHDRLIRYLHDNGIFSARTGLVDIGWRGTTHALIGALAKRLGTETPEAFYLGFTDDGQNPYRDISFGLITDTRRANTAYEMAAVQILSLLEASLQANHGMVSGLSEDDEQLEAVCVTCGAAREAELAATDQRANIQRGACDYATWYATQHGATTASPTQLRVAVQKKLARLAYAPPPNARAAGRLLVHVEPTDDQAATPLILPRGQGLKGWFAGLRSPWKGAYVFETLSWPGGILYLAVTRALNALSTDRKAWLRSFLFKEI